jgi:hypothetical protein
MIVAVKNGVYLDPTGHYCVVYLGSINGNLCITAVGHNFEGVEQEIVLLLSDVEKMTNFLNVIHQSEYLGEL